MTLKTHQRLLTILLAIASAGTTALIGLNVWARRDAPADSGNAQFKNTPPLGVPVLHGVPPFTLTQRDGSTVANAQLLGKVWVADFIFTRCAGPCRVMSRQMAGLQERLGDHPSARDIRLVSISVDSEYDTEPVLRRYAQEFEADAIMWLFLRGPGATVQKLVVDGFKLPLERNTDPNDPIIHSQRFVLVDQAGHVRGYYNGTPQEGPGGETLPAEMDALLRDLELVLAESEPE